MAFLQPAQADFTTTSYLRLTHALPDTGTQDVLPTGAVSASFNQPVVPLGADSSTLPAAFTLSPGAQGRGEWINTSTYVFYPEPGLDGGVSYTATLNQDLVSRQYPDEILAHFARHVRKDHVFVFQFHPEHSIRQRFHYRSHNLYCILFGHST